MFRNPGNCDGVFGFPMLLVYQLGISTEATSSYWIFIFIFIFIFYFIFIFFNSYQPSTGVGSF